MPREQLAEALATIASVVPDTDGDDDAEWRAELVARYGTVRGFIRLLVEITDFGAVEEAAADLVTGSWRRLVFADPDVPHGLVGKAAYSFCVLEYLHRSLCQRDVFARDGDRWGDPRAKLLAGGTVE
ncbi:hypothetical protein [Streptomyces murinus]|uniref:hypothetical protein n=1 Tax=Streptomyces murinus TaxID=33900 RepID=UPI0018F54282|nr:hypothetical protein [Streptomyces murinus]